MVVRRFRYLADPLCLTAIGLYWVNREWIKPSAWGHHGFAHDYLNDVLLIPIFLPLVLIIHRWLGMRTHDRPPSALEVTSHVTIWSVLFLVIFPLHEWLYRHSTADPFNAIAFAAGGAMAWLFWNRRTADAACVPKDAAPAHRTVVVKFWTVSARHSMASTSPPARDPTPLRRRASRPSPRTSSGRSPRSSDRSG